MKVYCVFCNGLGYEYRLPLPPRLMNHPEPVPKVRCTHCEGRGFYIHPDKK